MSVQTVWGEEALRRSDAQWKATAASTRPKIMHGTVQSKIFRRPMVSMYFRATRLKRKFVPETMRLTAVGWSNPISLKRVARWRIQ